MGNEEILHQWVWFQMIFSNDLEICVLNSKMAGVTRLAFLSRTYCYDSVFIMVTVKVNMSIGLAYSLICYCSIGSTVVLFYTVL